MLDIVTHVVGIERRTMSKVADNLRNNPKYNSIAPANKELKLVYDAMREVGKDNRASGLFLHLGSTRECLGLLGIIYCMFVTASRPYCLLLSVFLSMCWQHSPQRWLHPCVDVFNMC